MEQAEGASGMHLLYASIWLSCSVIAAKPWRLGSVLLMPSMQALLGGDCVRHMSPNVSIVSNENTLDLGYTEFRLKPGQFNLEQPFQRSNTTRQTGRNAEAAGSKRRRDDGVGTSNAETASVAEQHLPGHVQTIIDAHQQLLQLLGSAVTACTQQSTQHWAPGESREPSSAGAEVSVSGKLPTAATQHAAEQQQTATATTGPCQTLAISFSGRKAAQVAPSDLLSSAAPPDAAEDAAMSATAEDGTDWVALAAMKHLLKPKVSFTYTTASSTPQHQQKQKQQQNGSHAQQIRTPDQQEPQQQLEHTLTCNLFNTVMTNPSPAAVVAAAYDQEVLLPGRSTFCVSDLKAMQPFVQAVQDRGGASFVVIDPPWENASARRSAAYGTLTPNHLLYLPVKQLVKQDPGSLVALWMTNRPRLHKFVQQQLLPAWGLQHVATWFWLKVTDAGEPVSPLNSLHRHPFEQIWLLRVQSHGVAGSGHSSVGSKLEVTQQQQQQGRQEQQRLQQQHQEQEKHQQHLQQQQQQHADQGQHQQQGDSREDQQPQPQQGDQKQQQQEVGAVSADAELTVPPAAAAAEHMLSMQHFVKQPPESHVIISVPGQHSRKPHLGHLLMPYVSQQQRQHSQQQQGPEQACAADKRGQLAVAATAMHERAGNRMAAGEQLLPGEQGGVVCVELFARELFPGWMSWGNEVIRFQNVAYWTKL